MPRYSRYPSVGGGEIPICDYDWGRSGVCSSRLRPPWPRTSVKPSLWECGRQVPSLCLAACGHALHSPHAALAYRSVPGSHAHQLAHAAAAAHGVRAASGGFPVPAWGPRLGCASGLHAAFELGGQPDRQVGVSAGCLRGA